MNLKIAEFIIYKDYIMNSLSLKDIYFHAQIKRRVSLNPRYLDENFSKYIETIVKNNIEGKCVKEGYVHPGSVVILKRSMGCLNNNQFNGNIVFDLTVGATLCNIPVNSVIKANVLKINKLGILAKLGPLMIIVPKEIHTAKDPFKDIHPGNEIELLVIGKTFDLNSKEISVYAKLNSEAKKKIVIPMRKHVDKHKNKFISDDTIMPEEENFGEITRESEESIDRIEESEGSELEEDYAEDTIEDESEFEEELGDEGELDAEIIDNEDTEPGIEEVQRGENEAFSEDSEEEEEDDEEEDDDGDDEDYDAEDL